MASVGTANAKANNRLARKLAVPLHQTAGTTPTVFNKAPVIVDFASGVTVQVTNTAALLYFYSRVFVNTDTDFNVVNGKGGAGRPAALRTREPQRSRDAATKRVSSVTFAGSSSAGHFKTMILCSRRYSISELFGHVDE